MAPLPTALRNQLSKAIIEARAVAERGAMDALRALAVDHHEPHGSMTLAQRGLRNRLRAHGRQLGDTRDKVRGTQTINRLVREVAYEHWHRMLFARFLAESDLLIHPDAGVAVSLDEVSELAREQGVDPWELAGRFAEGMLPQIFRTDDPVLAVALPPETRQRLQRLLADLPSVLFTADDSLGWTYQFWQSAEKDAVNARVKSGEKITGETLPAVTQLFTEHYMVLFLLHNTVGAWWAGKELSDEDCAGATSEAQLRNKVALSGVGWEYLRFVREPRDGEDLNAGTGPWRPAAGTYNGWPRDAKSLRVLDPCCGSGHFLVAAFDLLVRLRIAEEGLAIDDAIRAVLRDNLFGLELDARCTQIAAFNLALAAWRVAGRHIDLPPLQIACSGIGPQSTKEEWLALAGTDPRVRDSLTRLYEQFELAPELGSLIDPRQGLGELPSDDSHSVSVILASALHAERNDDDALERVVAAHGIAKSAEILAGEYTLVITNVPFLGRGLQSEMLRAFADTFHAAAKSDLATVFMARAYRWCNRGSSLAVVTPQNWWFSSSYARFRSQLVRRFQINIAALLGEEAWESFGIRGPRTSLMTFTHTNIDADHHFSGVDVSSKYGDDLVLRDAKARLLAGPVAGDITASGAVRLVAQRSISSTSGQIIVLGQPTQGVLLSELVLAGEGTSTGDSDRFVRCGWELPHSEEWIPFAGSDGGSRPWHGRELLLRWENGEGELARSAQARVQNTQLWSKEGVLLGRIRGITATRFTGGAFDKACVVVVPRDSAHLPAIYSFLCSSDYEESVRQLDQRVAASTAALTSVVFDLGYWQDFAARKLAAGLAEPQSNDPTQWLFHGHPAGMLERGDAREPNTSDVLQVTIARLLGYRWPAELDAEMRLDVAARKWVERCTELSQFADDDGIICLSPVRGESSAADRSRRLLAAAFGDDWSAAKERELLAAAAEANNSTPRVTLDEWLRERFFEEHCKRFHHRPFVWHIWDGQRDGFNALVNYHRLAAPNGEGRRTLESLTYTYLGDWIERQRAEVREEVPGADSRLASAQDLQGQLERILAGEPPYDIFVRWKPLHEQPCGWDPDINDGVRLNIRPFLSATLRKGGRAGAGVLRWKPNIKWAKDRGKEPASIRPRMDYPWFWGWDEREQAHAVDFGSGLKDTAPAGKEFDGNRCNDLHYSRAAKEAARARADRAGANA